MEGPLQLANRMVYWFADPCTCCPYTTSITTRGAQGTLDHWLHRDYIGHVGDPIKEMDPAQQALLVLVILL